MRKILLCIAMATACADSADTETVDVQPVPAVDDGPAVDDASPYQASVETTPSVCELLPDDNSACAHACDADVVEQYIPVGTCAVLECTLTDGTVYRTGGCNFP